MYAGIKKADFECVVANGARLADELVEPLCGHGTVAIGIGIGPMSVTGRLAIDGHLEAHRFAVGTRAEHQMQIAGMEAVVDATVLVVQRGLLGSNSPVARQAPFVEPRCRRDIGMGGVVDRALLVDEVFGAPPADIGLRRLHVRLVRRGFRTGRLHVDHIGCDVGLAGLRQKLLDHPLGTVVIAFTEVMVAHAPLGIDEIMRRPILVFEGAPDGIVVIDGDGIGDLEIADRLLDVVDVLLECELRRMHADHHQPLILVLFRPGADIGNGAQAVDAGVGPEIDENDFALQ